MRWVACKGLAISDSNNNKNADNTNREIRMNLFFVPLPTKGYSAEKVRSFSALFNVECGQWGDFRRAGETLIDQLSDPRAEW